jgi:hypothetical protein
MRMGRSRSFSFCYINQRREHEEDFRLDGDRSIFLLEILLILSLGSLHFCIYIVAIILELYLRPYHPLLHTYLWGLIGHFCIPRYVFPH